jgi:hypothetical protein
MLLLALWPSRIVGKTAEPGTTPRNGGAEPDKYRLTSKHTNCCWF